MNFVNPAFLLLLPLLPLLAVLWFFLRVRADRRLAAFTHSSSNSSLFFVQLLLLTAGLLLLTLAASRPQWGFRDETVTTRSRNLLIAVDVSRSMLAQDVHPNRLGRAKADILDLIAELQGDRAAILAFRYTAVLLSPLTTDAAFLRQTVETLSPDLVPPGPTDLAAAIIKSLDALDPVQDEYNAILLISDGEELSGAALDAARLAARRNIPIFTVGIGDPRGAPIPDGKGGFLQYQGQNIITALDESSLQAIANASGGKYISLATAGTAHTTLGAIYRNHLRTLAAREQQETRERQIQERYHLFLIPSLLLLLIAASLSRGRLASPRRKNVECRVYNVKMTSKLFLISTLCILHSTFVFANGENGTAAAREAQSLLRKNQPLAAAELFEHASRTTTVDRSPPYAFNAALAFLKAGQPDNALRLLTPLTSDPKLGPRANDLVAKTTLANATAATNAVQKLAILTTTATHLQHALRDAPSATREQNFARVAPLLPKAREEARIEKILEQYKGQQPPQLLQKILASQRKLLLAAPDVFTNAPASLIPAAERLAQQQRDNADIWIPLKPALLEPITNVQFRAELETLIEQARDTMTLAAVQLDNLDPDAIQPVTLAETLPYRLWFLTAEPPALIDENLFLQTNAIAHADTPLFPTRPDQPEAHRLTQRFRETFPEWADQVQQSNTNFTDEVRAEIETLAAETEDLQFQATLKSDPNRPALQQQAFDNLLRIKELLPKDPSQQNQQQDQSENQDSQSSDDDSQSSEDSQSSQDDTDDNSQPEEQPQPEPGEQSESDPQTPEKIREMLRRALERSEEHEAKKRQQQNHRPPPPHEKDW